MPKYLVHILFGVIVLSMPFLYVFHPAYAFSDLSKGWIEALVKTISIIFLFFVASKWIGVKHFNGDGELDEQEKSKIKSFFKSAFITYFEWGVVQQGIAIGIYLFASSIHYPSAIFVTSLIFCAFHLPNFILMLAVFGLSQMFLIHFNEYNNVIWVLVGHGFFGTVLNACLPPKISTEWTVFQSFAEAQKKI